MLDSVSNYVDKFFLGLVGLGITLVGWGVRVVFTNSKKIEKTEAILEHLTETMKEHRKDLHELRSENSQAAGNQARILELMERMKND